MAKFFVPGAKTAKEAEEVRTGVVKFAESNGFSVTDRKVFCLTYTHNSREYRAEVGMPDVPGSEIVIVILDAEGLYLICTPNRGVVRGLPILVGNHHVLAVEDFE
jgi:hypothetical protein